MDALVFLIIVLLVVGATIVFFAHHFPSTIYAKTGIAALGFLIIFIAVAFTGVY